MALLIIDTREKPELPSALIAKIDPKDVRREYLPAGDYIIEATVADVQDAQDVHTASTAREPAYAPDASLLFDYDVTTTTTPNPNAQKKEPIIIERKKFDDFIGSIKSGRLDEQLEKCLGASANVILLLEGNHTAHSKMPPASYVAKIAAISQRGVQVINVKNAAESCIFIKKLFDMQSSTTTEQEKEKAAYQKRRDIKKEPTDYEQAISMLTGISGIGPKTAIKLLDDGKSINYLLHAYSKKYTENKHVALIRRICAAIGPTTTTTQ